MAGGGKAAFLAVAGCWLAGFCAPVRGVRFGGGKGNVFATPAQKRAHRRKIARLKSGVFPPTRKGNQAAAARKPEKNKTHQNLVICLRRFAISGKTSRTRKNADGAKPADFDTSVDNFAGCQPAVFSFRNFTV